MVWIIGAFSVFRGGISRLLRSILFFFFFQAEDGIRDLVRSRGLGDVYKRQDHRFDLARAVAQSGEGHAIAALGKYLAHRDDLGPVSYTHLTLPTSDLV